MFTLIELPYAPDALEPVISASTISFHHGKHLQTYVDNLNKLLPGSPFEGKTLEEIVVASAVMPGQTGHPAVFNNAGQILNHNLYFTQFHAPVTQSHPPVTLSDSEGSPSAGPLRRRIEAQWGSFAAFQADFEAKGAGLFGSGWVWLAAAQDGSIVITQEPGAGNPLTRGLRPLLPFDVWEHAYYLDWQNRRAAHLAALWQIVDWEEIERRYK